MPFAARELVYRSSQRHSVKHKRYARLRSGIVIMFEELIDKYRTSPVIRGLVQFFPMSAAADAAITAHLQNIEKERLREFFEELARGQFELNAQLIENNDFLHAFFHTVKAALACHRKEKIQMLARLLVGFGCRQTTNEYPFDEFEEYLAVLDQLSWRELSILAGLADFERQFPLDQFENDRARTSALWPGFQTKVTEDHNISEHELRDILMRLLRTGFYQPYVGGYGGGSFSNAEGRLTHSFYRFLERIDVRNLA